jgi:23S rRNA (cytidine1920-2'-O)/16S rRNA (cytidine1409-2'-O)-methyltransferase
VHERVCAEGKGWFESQGWAVLGIVPSPITGPEGNVEFLLGAEKNG